MTYPATLPPANLEGYSFAPNKNSMSTEFEAGHKRKRRLFRDVNTNFSVSWLYTIAQLGEFEAWYKETIDDGVEWFDIDLLNGLGVGTMSARFIEPYKVDAVSPEHFRVTANLEIENMPYISGGEYDTLTGA